jgi:DNA-binding NtrC family response regulator
MDPKESLVAATGADPRRGLAGGRGAPGGPVEAQPAGRPRILVADDDDAMRALVRDILRTLAADFDEAASGLELITCLAERGPYALVITDVRMPWMSGVQGVIAARHAGLAIPFIVMTAFGNAAVQHIVDAMQGAVLLSKPFSADELRATAARLLDPESRRAPGRPEPMPGDPATGADPAKK